MGLIHPLKSYLERYTPVDFKSLIIVALVWLTTWFANRSKSRTTILSTAPLTLINDPQKCNNCKNKFCYNCIKNIKKCPLCRVEPFTFSKYIEEKKPINDDNPFKPISFKYLIPELKIKTKECLEMYLDERDYIKEKIPKWRDYVINDLKLFLEH